MKVMGVGPEGGNGGRRSTGEGMLAVLASAVQCRNSAANEEKEQDNWTLCRGRTKAQSWGSPW